MDAKDRVISAAYYNVRTGYGSIEHTLRQAREVDPSIKREDVKRFLDRQEVRQRKRPNRYNSFIPNGRLDQIQVDLADFGKGGPITGEVTWDADLDPMTPGSRIPDPVQGGPSLMGKPLTRTFISSIDAAQDVLKKLDVAMDKVNQVRATMGAVMNRLDHVVNNLTNVSMNLSGSRSQIEDADYASASTELAKTQIMQQAATAVLAQANTSQQSVMKLLQG